PGAGSGERGAVRPGSVLLPAPCSLLPLRSQQEADHSGAGAEDSERGGGPKGEHPFDEVCAGLLDLHAQLGDAPLPPRVGFRDTVLELRVEPPEVQLVQLAEIRSVGGVHRIMRPIEPIRAAQFRIPHSALRIGWLILAEHTLGSAAKSTSPPVRSPRSGGDSSVTIRPRSESLFDATPAR